MKWFSLSPHMLYNIDYDIIFYIQIKTENFLKHQNWKLNIFWNHYGKWFVCSSGANASFSMLLEKKHSFPQCVKLSFYQVKGWKSLTVAGLQLRKSERNGFSFLNQTLLCDPHWNRLSETIPLSGNIIGFGWEIRKLAFWKLSILDLICCPG